MLHPMKANEIANPVPVGFLCSNAVVIHPNDCADLIAKTRLLSCHVEGSLPIAVCLHSIIVGADHRSQMITWQQLKDWAKLLFYRFMDKELTVGDP